MVVAHVEGVESNRKHVMRLRIACVGSMNHLLDPVEPHRQWRVQRAKVELWVKSKSSLTLVKGITGVFQK